MFKNVQAKVDAAKWVDENHKGKEHKTSSTVVVGLSGPSKELGYLVIPMPMLDLSLKSYNAKKDGLEDLSSTIATPSFHSTQAIILKNWVTQSMKEGYWGLQKMRLLRNTKGSGNGNMRGYSGLQKKRRIQRCCKCYGKKTCCSWRLHGMRFAFMA